jgi:hypothetical protein
MARNRTSVIRAGALHSRLRLDGDCVQDVSLGLGSFFKQLGGLPTERARDLLYVCAAIYAADRCVRRDSRAAKQGWIRSINLVIGVRDIHFWSQAVVAEKLQELTTFLSDDDWIIQFDHEAAPAPSLEEHHNLQLRLSGASHIALYSGGLDSAAGLALRAKERPGAYQLVTVIHQVSLHRIVEGQLRALRGQISVPLVPAFLVAHLSGGSAKRLSLQEQTQRCRALLFTGAGAVAAMVTGARCVELFENGIGALNVPLMTGMLSGGLATRGAHPTFLRLMSELVSLVAQRQIDYVLPFRGFTKAEMVRGAAANDLGGWLLDSRSCVHSSLRVTGKHHCGVCPACLGRRQAYLSGGVAENIPDYEVDVFAASEQAIRDLDRAYLRLEVLAARRLMSGSTDALQHFRRHLAITKACISPEDEAAWLEVLKRYAGEWCDLADKLVAGDALKEHPPQKVKAA